MKFQTFRSCFYSILLCISVVVYSKQSKISGKIEWEFIKVNERVNYIKGLFQAFREGALSWKKAVIYIQYIHAIFNEHSKEDSKVHNVRKTLEEELYKYDTNIFMCWNNKTL